MATNNFYEANKYDESIMNIDVINIQIEIIIYCK